MLLLARGDDDSYVLGIVSKSCKKTIVQQEPSSDYCGCYEQVYLSPLLICDNSMFELNDSMFERKRNLFRNRRYFQYSLKIVVPSISRKKEFLKCT